MDGWASRSEVNSCLVCGGSCFQYCVCVSTRTHTHTNTHAGREEKRRKRKPKNKDTDTIGRDILSCSPILTLSNP